jgi:NAD(P)-dependent dehydrogenase (short-subunit alcohol dehydrogenase family)
MHVDLSGSTAIVTGAGRGIGREIASRFADAGADIVAVARTESEIDETAHRCRERHSVETLAVPTDLKHVEDIDAVIDETVRTLGAPDILVNNAAENLTNLPQDQPVEDVDTMLDTNLRGLFVLTQRFSRVFRESDLDAGRVINVASIAAQLGVPAMTLYGGTKSGVYGITRGFAADLADDGVTVNSVTPGLIGIERIEQLIEEKGDELYNLDRIPVGRVGQAEDIAKTCLFLASDHAEYITGEDIRVDGGVEFTAGLYK